MAPCCFCVAKVGSFVELCKRFAIFLFAEGRFCSNAVSTGKCKISDLFEKLGLWVRKTEFFARSEVQFLCDVLNILVRDVIEV